jgi:hypothetical protein
MMITRCHPRVNDKRPPKATSFIDTLFKTVRGRGFVRRSSEKDYFLLLICSFCALAAVIFGYLRFCRFSMALYMTKRGTRDVAPHATLLL